MAGQRQPINLLEARGKKHLTKNEIEQRKQSEITAASDAVIPPDYLSKAQAVKFDKIASELLRIDIMSNLDCDALARYIQSEDKYLRYDKLVNQTLAKAGSFEKALDVVVVLEKFENLRDKSLKQCRAAASDLGLTISSRCKLVVPKPQEKPENKFSKFGGAKNG